MNDFACLSNPCFAIYKSKYCDDCELFLLERNKSITRLREKKDITRILDNLLHYLNNYNIIYNAKICSSKSRNRRNSSI
jgi:hypothetical protein